MPRLSEDINGMVPTIQIEERERGEDPAHVESFMENTPLVAVQEFDRSGTLIRWNGTSARLYGYNRVEALGRKLQHLILDDEDIDGFETAVKAIWETSEPTPLTEWKVRTQTGEHRWVLSSMFPVCGNGGLTGILRMDVDITERKRTEEEFAAAKADLEDMNGQLEEAIANAQKLAVQAQIASISKSDFLARMSHEIRTPISGVIGFTDILMDTSLTEEQRDYVKTIKQSGEILLSLINDLLDFSKIEAGRLSLDLTDFDPEVTVYDVCDLIRPRIMDKPIELLCRVGDQIPILVRGDSGRFRQVLLNLMGNAAKFTEAGEIELSLDVEEESAEQVRLHIRVRDTGRGVPQGKLKLIFDAFRQAGSLTTRKYGGTGLGLSICKQLSQLMGGDVWAESAPHEGSVFHFTAWLGKAQRRQSRQVAAAVPMAGKKILVVDNNRTNLDILEHTLQTSGLRVVTLSSGEGVVPALGEAQDRGDPFDLCIIDLQMPVISGYELAGRVRAARGISHIPLLACSCLLHPSMKECHQSGFDGFLSKPARRRRLLEMMERVIRGKQNGHRQANASHRIVTRHSLLEEAKHSVRILLAEDNPANRKLAELLLAKGGYHVEAVENGREAVDKYTAAPDRFDLILMDVRMPELDGLQATRDIRARGLTRIPIVALTGNAMKRDREECLEAGMNDCIVKPVRRENVYEVIRKWVFGKESP